MILTQFQTIFTDRFCGYLSNLIRLVTRNMDLRDASASKKNSKKREVLTLKDGNELDEVDETFEAVVFVKFKSQVETLPAR